MNRRNLLAAATAIGAAAIGGGVALGAGAQLRGVEVSVIHATRVDGGGAIDPLLRDLPQLTRQQPFVRYNVFKLLDRRELPIGNGKPVVYSIVDGRSLMVTLADLADAGAPASSDGRYRVRAEIAGPEHREFLKLLEVTASTNEPFFVGGQSYRGGTLFLELVLR